jgi:hypothetical protein
MKKSLFYIVLTLISSFFLLHSFFNQFILLKVFGIILLMFSIYKLQYGIPSKVAKIESDFVKQDEEE